MSGIGDYARALRVVEGYLERRRRGVAEDPADLLAGHPDLRDILVGMLDEPTGAATTPDGGRTGGGPRASDGGWYGLPGEGDVVGGYRIVRPLGQGGMGVVFLAADLRLERQVALKVVRPERLGSSAARERFWREAKLAARLEHPSICPVYEVGEANGVPFMAMRFVAGETLAARLERQPRLPGSSGTAGGTGGDDGRGRVDELLGLLAEVARALHFAHEHGVVHRDIKPGNILIEPDGNPVVLDFGMARGGDDLDAGLTMTGELAGTPLYMAPEQVAGKGRVDHRADVFALGVTVYEAAAGVRPFGGASMRELLDAVVGRDPPPPSRVNRHLPRDLDVVVAKALDKDADRRYRTAADLAADLDRVRRREPVAARRAGPLLRLRRWVQRNPVAVAFLALIASALAVFTLLYLEAEAARRDFDLVSLVPRLQELRDQQAGLYGDWPNHADALGGWLHRAAALRAAVVAARPVLARLAGTADPAQRFLHDTLAGVDAAVEALFAEHGFVPRVQRNRQWALHERQRSVDGFAAAWREAAAAVAASSRYGGLELAPQHGLVPIGADPQSGLWEFGHPRSGAVPVRTAAGTLAPVDVHTGIVFVLVPGGTFLMGCQAADAAAPGFDPGAAPEEGPPHPVTLGPFFLAKHELTQAQWQRLGDGRNPSYFDPGGRWSVPLAPTHPVESVSWFDCTEVLAEHGLLLPTEAQWEYACRGGTTTPWWTGDEPAALSGRVNLADQAAQRVGLRFYHFDRRLDDGFPVTAPVDALAANGFGLHHVAGNVLEWCRDVFAGYDRPVSGSDGLRGGTDGPLRVIRSAAFDSPADYARSAKRRQDDPASRDKGMGLRAARALR